VIEFNNKSGDNLSNAHNQTDIQTFSSIIKYQTEENLLAVMKKVSAKDLGKAITIQDSSGWNGLLRMVYRSTDKAILFAINKIPQEDLDKAIRTPASDGCTPLHDIPKYREEATVAKLIELTSSTALNKCCELKSTAQRNVIDWIFLYLSTATIVPFFKKIDLQALEALFKPSNLKPIAQNYINKIAEGILNDSLYQDENLIKNFFDLMGNQLAPICLKYWNEGKPLSPMVHTAVLTHISFFSKAEANAFIKYLPLQWYLPDYEEKTDLTPVLTSKGTSLDISHPKLPEVIWEEGFSNWNEYRRFRLLESKLPNIQVALESLYTSDRVLTGANDDFSFVTMDEKEEKQFKNILQCTEEENTLIKIIKNKDWEKFFNQISDYSNRADLRKKANKADETKFSHKYVHLENKVVEYKHKRKTKTHTMTKKTAATLISKKMNTSVFGEHEAIRDLVGLFIDMSQCKVKAMLSQDRGTYSRKWVGSEAEVLKYKSEIEGISFTDKNKFREFVRANPHRLNELLVGISREAIMAIVIVTDNPEARKEALDRQHKLKELQIFVPIVYYDRPLQKIRLLVDVKERNEYALKKTPSILIQKAMATPQEFFGFLDTISKATLEEAIVKKSAKHNEFTALHQAAISQKSDSFLKFIKLLPDSVLEYTSSLVDNDGNSVFSMVAANQSEEVFKYYSDAVQNELKDLLKRRNKNNISGFQVVLENQSEDIFNSMLKYANFEYNVFLQSNQTNVFLQCNNEGNNLFHIAASLKKELVFRQLLSEIPFNQQRVSLREKNSQGETPLHIMAANFSESFMRGLYYDNSFDLKDDLFLNVNVRNETVIHIAAVKQASKSMYYFLKSCSSATLEEASQFLTVDNKNLLDVLFAYQTTETVKWVLDRVDDEALDFLIFHGKNSQVNVNRICEIVLYEPHLVSVPFDDAYIPSFLFNKFLNHFALGPILINAAQEAWLAGYNLPSILIQAIQEFLNKDNQTLSNDQYSSLENIVNAESKMSSPVETKAEQSKNIFKQINKNTPLDEIWHHGVKSWKNYHDLRSVQDEVPGLSEVLDRLYHMDRVFEGSYQPFDFASLGNQSYQINSCVHAGRGLVKIIDETSWQDNLSRLQNSTFQPQNEMLTEVKADSVVYDFLKDVIRIYKPEDYQSDNTYTHPTTARLISYNLNSIISTQLGSTKPQVGLLFDSQFCQIQAMLMLDGHLKPGQWVGSENQVKEYCDAVSANSYQEFKAFSEVVATIPHKLNEVLVRFSKEGLRAIIIAEDSPEARLEAQKRCEQIEVSLNIKLPIFFYNNLLRKLRLYTADEMLEDKILAQPDISQQHPREIEARLRLLATKKFLENESSLKKFSIFGTKAKPKTAESIIMLIDAAEKDPKAEWSKLEIEIEKKLKAAIEKPGKTRKATTQASYEKAIQIVSKTYKK